MRLCAEASGPVWVPVTRTLSVCASVCWSIRPSLGPSHSDPVRLCVCMLPLFLTSKRLSAPAYASSDSPGAASISVERSQRALRPFYPIAASALGQKVRNARWPRLPLTDRIRRGKIMCQTAASMLWLLYEKRLQSSARQSAERYDTIRDAILTCARKPT